MGRRNSTFVRDVDIRELPSYGFTEAGHYLRVPPTTIRCWVAGRYYPSQTGPQFSKPIVQLPDPRKRLLSFMNLIEIHVLDAIRREHNIALEKVRIAVAYLSKHFPSKHPLADREFETDGMDLFIQKFGKLISISQHGQLAMKEVLEAHLHRIERDLAGIPVKLYPFTRKRDIHDFKEEPKAVVIDPRVSYGRPVLVGTGIPTAVVAERYKAGESMDDLADDYGLTRLEIEEAIRCELSLEAA
ncbi:MAG TPA: DUF433 domain-containing protein [Nitrospiraceae bacterium]|nr:DUF433 domain-containing protein [Nitrospiraceae bacterium]